MNNQLHGDSTLSGLSEAADGASQEGGVSAVGMAAGGSTRATAVHPSATLCRCRQPHICLRASVSLVERQRHEKEVPAAAAAPVPFTSPIPTARPAPLPPSSAPALGGPPSSGLATSEPSGARKPAQFSRVDDVSAGSSERGGAVVFHEG